MCVAQRVLPRGEGQPSQVKIAPLAYLANLTADREPIIRSDFDVYLADGSLIYAKSQCGESDVEATFFANIYPVDADDLSDDRRHYGYAIIDFDFDDYGAIADDGRCWAALKSAELPRRRDTRRAVCCNGGRIRPYMGRHIPLQRIAAQFLYFIPVCPTLRPCASALNSRSNSLPNPPPPYKI